MSEVERAIWLGMLDAEMNALYYGYLSRRYARYEKFTQIFVAVVSTSAIASLQIWKAKLGWFEWGWIWNALSIMAVIASITAPLLGHSNISRKSAILRPVFIEYRDKYEDLWFKRNKIKQNALQQKLYEIKKDLNKRTTDDSTLPRNIKLLKKCQKEIIDARGLHN